MLLRIFVIIFSINAFTLAVLTANVEAFWNEQLKFVYTKNALKTRSVENTIAHSDNPWIHESHRDMTTTFFTTDFQGADGFGYRSTYNFDDVRVYSDIVTLNPGDTSTTTERLPYTTTTPVVTKRFYDWFGRLYSGTNSPKHSGGIFEEYYFILDPDTHQTHLESVISSTDLVQEKSADTGRIFFQSVRGKDKNIKIKLFADFQIDTITDEQFGPKEIPPPLQVPAKSFDPKRFKISVLMSNGSIYPKAPKTITATRIDNISSKKVSTATSWNGDGTKYAEFINWRTTGKFYAEFEVVPRYSDVIGIGVETDYGYLTFYITSITAEPAKTAPLDYIKTKFIQLFSDAKTKILSISLFKTPASITGDSIFTFTCYGKEFSFDLANYSFFFTSFKQLFFGLTCFFCTIKLISRQKGNI
jgi:hypothetical protein